MKNSLFILCSLILMYSCQSNPPDFSAQFISDPFENPPEDSALLFAPGTVSQGLYERDIAINKDRDEIFFGVLTGKHTCIMSMKKSGNQWTRPELASFSRDSRFFFLEPAFSPDEQRLYFLSTIPRIAEDSLPGWANQNIWYVERKEDGSWSEIKDLGDPINSGGGEFFPSFSNNGNLYFTWNAKDSPESYVKMARWTGEGFADPILLPENVNGKGQIFNACISPDESYLIGCASGRETNSGRTPLYYVFFNLGDGNWSEAINLQEKVNLPGSAAISPYISRDGKYLFFASTFSPEKNGDDNSLSAEEIYSHYSKPQNGLSDIYWISTDFISELKPE